MTQWLRHCCSWRGPEFNSQHPHGMSEPSATPVPGDPTGIHVMHMHTGKKFIHTNIQHAYRQKIHIHKVNLQKILVFIFCLWMFCLNACMCTVFILGVRRDSRISELKLGFLQAAMRCWELNLTYSFGS